MVLNRKTDTTIKSGINLLMLTFRGEIKSISENIKHLLQHIHQYCFFFFFFNAKIILNDNEVGHQQINKGEMLIYLSFNNTEVVK